MMVYETNLRKCSEGLFFSWDHYNKVLKARKAFGIDDVDRHILQPSFHLVGKKLRSKLTGKTYNVVRCHKEWWIGWFYSLLLECNDSHVKIYWETCDGKENGVDYINKAIKERKEDFEIID